MIDDKIYIQDQIRDKLNNDETLDVYEMLTVGIYSHLFTEEEREKAYEQGANLYTEGNL